MLAKALLKHGCNQGKAIPCDDKNHRITLTIVCVFSRPNQAAVWSARSITHGKFLVPKKEVAKARTHGLRLCQITPENGNTDGVPRAADLQPQKAKWRLSRRKPVIQRKPRCGVTSRGTAGTSGLWHHLTSLPLSVLAAGSPSPAAPGCSGGCGAARSSCQVTSETFVLASTCRVTPPQSQTGYSSRLRKTGLSIAQVNKIPGLIVGKYCSKSIFLCSLLEQMSMKKQFKFIQPHLGSFSYRKTVLFLKFSFLSLKPNAVLTPSA